MASRFTLRMMAPLMGISALLLLVGGGGAWYVNRLNVVVSASLDQNIKSLLASESLALALRDTRVALHRYQLDRDRADLDAALACRSESEQALTDAAEFAASQQTKDLIKAARTAHDRFFDNMAELGRHPSAADSQRADALMSDLTEKVLSATLKLLDHDRRQATSESERNNSLAERLGLGLLLLGCCGAVAGLLVGFAIARGVSRSLVQLSIPVRDTAGKLAEVVGPIVLASNAGLPELEIVMRTIAAETSDLVAQLQQREREALRREQLAAVGQLAAGLAHELRNPLTSMKILVQAAAAEPGSLSGHDLQVIEQEITRLEHLTRTFLDFARPQQLRKQVCDLRNLIEQTRHVVSGRAAQQGVVLDCRIPYEPLAIEADAAQIRQVILNLLLNALDALPGGGRITIEVVFAQDGEVPQAAGVPGFRGAPGHRPPDGSDSSPPLPGRWLLVRICDDGAGLPRELGDRIFEPFVSTRGTGIGLGLTICRRIVEAHGGTIEAVNGTTRGAEFRIRLPRSTGAISAGAGDMVAIGAAATETKTISAAPASLPLPFHSDTQRDESKLPPTADRQPAIATSSIPATSQLTSRDRQDVPLPSPPSR